MKVDQEHRTVSGFATLDNVDRQGDIVSTAASLDAFSEFRGNLREMHQSIAVGKVLTFSVEEFYDPSADNGLGKVYSGIFVTAYISKGANDTWEKVLDGTLSGFSIGGEILESENVFDKALGVMVRMITKYALIELSVVDSPANQLANILSVIKNDGVMTLKGISADIKTENIFWCSQHQIAVIKEADAADCIDCGRPMENIGWVESDDIDKADAIRTLIKNYSADSTIENTLGEGGKNMPNEVNDTTEVEVVEKSVTVDEVVVEAAVEETVVEEVEKVAVADEVVTEEPDLAKMIGEIRELVTKTVEERATENAEAIAAIAKSVADNSASFNEAITAITEAQKSLLATVEGLSTAIESVSKTVTAIDEADAIKKSGDLGRSTEVTKNSIWGDVFRVR
jgi:predicted DNA-binding ribbon-helix-helix protein